MEEPGPAARTGGAMGKGAPGVVCGEANHRFPAMGGSALKDGPLHERDAGGVSDAPKNRRETAAVTRGPDAKPKR